MSTDQFIGGAKFTEYGAQYVTPVDGSGVSQSNQITISQTSLAVTASSQTLIAANANRKYLQFMVIGTQDVTISPASPAVFGAGLIYSNGGSNAQGASEDFQGRAPTNAFYAIAAGTGSTIYVWEGV